MSTLPRHPTVLSRSLLALGILFGAASLGAQQTINRNETPSANRPAASAENIPVTTSSRTQDTDVVEMSQFVVQEDRDNGYAATDSLAGTRLRTPLKDIAASVSVVTKDLLDDLGATNTEQLLVYTAGTEVVGIGGNYSGSVSESAAQNFETLRESTSSVTRVRGLAAADQTRNYFLSPGIPLDSYNTQSVTINRGANAILFGFGSPAGIIENSLIAPSFKNRVQVRLNASSYDSTRASIDVDQVILKNKLAVRVAALTDNRRYEQNFSMRDQERYFGAITYKPFKWTTVRLNGEHGHLDQRLPRTDPPVDSLTTWWDFNQPTRDNIFTSTATKNYQRANNLDGMAGNWSQNAGLIYNSIFDTLPSDAYVPYATNSGVTYRFLAPRSSQEIAANIAPVNPLAGFMVGKQITDRSIFDYRKQMIDGPNSGTWMDFDTVNIAVEQLFLKGDAGIEVVYDRQKATSSTYRLLNTYRGNNIFIDVNTKTPDGRDNPNFGRPFLSSNGFYNYVENLYQTGRATAYLRHNFAKNSRNFWARLLGTQTVTGMYSTFKREEDLRSGYNAAVEPTWRDGLNGNTLGTSRKISHVVYLAPSMANMNTPAGASILGIQSKLTIPSSADIMVINSSTGNVWARQSPRIYSFDTDDGYKYTTNTVTYNRNKVESWAGVWQGDWMNNLLVTTVGWRRDSDSTAKGSNAGKNDPTTGALVLTRPILPASNDTDKDTLSYGGALHVPPKWFARIPGKPTLSFYYNYSENFDVAAGVRYDLIGNSFDPQEGSTKEIGFRIGALNNKLSLRATWYETTQDNMTDSRVQGILVRTADLENRIIGSFSKTWLDSIGYVGYDSPSASSLFLQYLSNYSFRVGDLQTDGTRSASYTNPVGVCDVTSSTSKGLEIEAVYNVTKNWRMLVNVVRQEATRGDTSAMLTALINDRLPQWQNPELWPLVMAGGVQYVNGYVAQYITNPLNTAKLSSGERTPELREWRVNLVTNYSFPTTTVLKGWAVGGAARWEDSVSIGYPVINDPVLGLVTDVKNPYMGASQTNFDAWLSYTRKFKYFNWKIQLNVRNLLNDNTFIPVKANPVTVGDLSTYDVAAYRIGAERSWEVSMTFTF